jgi:hypothetical protein
MCNRLPWEGKFMPSLPGAPEQGLKRRQRFALRRQLYAFIAGLPEQAAWLPTTLASKAEILLVFPWRVRYAEKAGVYSTDPNTCDAS